MLDDWKPLIMPNTHFQPEARFIWTEDQLSQQLTAYVLGALLLYFAYQRLTEKKLNVPILLADQIPSASKRALEYCYHPRDVMTKGYAKVSNNSRLRCTLVKQIDYFSSKTKHSESTQEMVRVVLILL
jgi:hypothetical protein